MADGEGRLIDCKNIVFFLTSNLGYQVIVEHADDPETMQEALYPVLADFFKPALLARMEVVPYLPLSKETLATIIAGKLARLDNVLRSRFWRGRDYWAGSDGRNHEPRHPRGKRREDAGIGYRRRHAAAALAAAVAENGGQHGDCPDSPVGGRRCVHGRCGRCAA